MRFWIGVASRTHVQLGVRGGYAQFSHGRETPARRPAKGDWVVYYSPKLDFEKPEPCRRFTAIGQIIDDSPVQVEQSPGFKPWRRKIEYHRATEVEITQLISQLTFIRNKSSWGAVFRFGFLMIPRIDFETIASSMGVAITFDRDVSREP